MKTEKTEIAQKSKNGGKREGAGRKPLLNQADLALVKTLIGQHGSELDPLKKKEKVLVLMDVLYQEGQKGNIIAVKEYLDRQMGKSKESINHVINTEGFNLVLNEVISPNVRDNLQDNTLAKGDVE